ncbi:DUF3231 family protein [Paenibacillus flagellatus]|uniref:Sugar isomerase n=1 Tax=Paenibacillus flagellatus TaxID=2211139 RepID=A0A2V5K843_9BACL|nr:DUF3231 family protein [Paenibacillus flagellatus]PYI55659.1 sugar isomerase [Paenibacillus flagellatus]
MKITHEVGLSSTEIAGLWSTYINECMSVCITKHFQQMDNSDDIATLIDRTLRMSLDHLSFIRGVFEAEQFPIPKGFSDEDLHLSAPPLFFDLFPVSYIYGMSRMALLNYSILTSNVARKDIRTFFSNCLKSTLDLYNLSVNLMLAKGIYDRPPMIPYPERIEFIHKKETFLSKWLEKQRPLNVLELSEMFFNIERNYFGLILLTGFIQVVNDDEIKQFLIRGKELTMKQIHYLNDTLVKDDLSGSIMVNSEVSTSTISPFSNRLIMTLVTMLNTQGMTYIGHALGTASRVDLVAQYSKLIPEILDYGKEGMDIMIARKWLEEPPHAPDREKLAHV